VQEEERRILEDHQIRVHVKYLEEWRAQLREVLTGGEISERLQGSLKPLRHKDEKGQRKTAEETLLKLKERIVEMKMTFPMREEDFTQEKAAKEKLANSESEERRRQIDTEGKGRGRATGSTA
jgi:hypothetical protein